MAGAEGHDHVHSRSEAERFWTNKLAGELSIIPELIGLKPIVCASNPGRTAEPFPDLTGNRASAKNGETKQESILSQVSVHELQVSVAKLETSPLAVSQAAWAILLVCNLSSGVILGHTLSFMDLAYLLGVGRSDSNIWCRLPTAFRGRPGNSPALQPCTSRNCEWTH